MQIKPWIFKSFLNRRRLYFFFSIFSSISLRTFFLLSSEWLAETNSESVLPSQLLSARYTAKIQPWLTETRCLLFDCRQGLGKKPVDRVALGDCECHNLLMFFFIFESSFLLAIISPEEARANAPPTPPSGIAAGRSTTESWALKIITLKIMEVGPLQWLPRVYGMRYLWS